MIRSTLEQLASRPDLNCEPDAGRWFLRESLLALLDAATSVLQERALVPEVQNSEVPGSEIGADPTLQVGMTHTASLVARPWADLHLVLVTASASTSGPPRTSHSTFADATGALAEAALAANASIGFVLNLGNMAVISALGDPRLSSVYKTGPNGFNMALTLRALRTAGEPQTSSVQAQLLSRGILAQALTPTSASNAMVLYPLPPKWGRAAALRRRHCSRCIEYLPVCELGAPLGCRTQPVVCPDHQICAPLYGCVAQNTTPPSQELPPLLRVSDEREAGAPRRSWSMANIVTDEIPRIEWSSPRKGFARDIIAGGRPVVLRNTVVERWPARKLWSMPALAKRMLETGAALDYPVRSIDLTPEQRLRWHSNRVFSLDWNTYLGRHSSEGRVPLLNRTTAYRENIYDVEELFSRLNASSSGTDPFAYYYFGSLPAQLRDDVSPSGMMWLTENDLKLFRQFLWISNGGLRTHTHFDQDHNFFVQLVGSKRFTVWPAAQHELMHLYPRVHPLWHKSQLDFDGPDIDRFPSYQATRAQSVVLMPGDLLYVPPYTWHTVESINDSVSLSTWSHCQDVYEHMDAAYNFEHKFEQFPNKSAHRVALIVYLDFLTEYLLGTATLHRFAHHIFETRLREVLHLFPPLNQSQENELCVTGVRSEGRLPMAKFVLQDIRYEAQSVAGHFASVGLPEARDILLTNYIEELVSNLVGVEAMPHFLVRCIPSSPVLLYYVQSGQPAYDWLFSY
eukprot:TRINITY_DN6896_c0_g1_i1.p1 TRINITY_DN6896_c0_g1~~TRINITY_DN6896_c0_g1_i1.p1  ORF type:complete len:860 (-),score=151.92 TRINITY_DN6896_c0_g1_i1:72-2291(-)